jgi:O-methyltransferase involved in polyketide biosynthesis
VADFDSTKPSIARVYDFLLDGKDNFAVDREVAQKLLTVAPDSADVMRENRQFLARAVRWAAGQGITQFIDLGCGMPTTPNTHGSAGAVTDAPRVAYVDNDAVVLASLRAPGLRALAAPGHPGVTVIEGDVRETAAILSAVSAGIDLTRPACLVMGALLHFFPADAARELVAGYVAALAPGSYLVLSVGRADGEMGDKGFGAYSSGGTRAYNHPVADFAGFFGPLELVPPGVSDARLWHPELTPAGPLPPRPGQSLVGVARVGYFQSDAGPHQ